MIIGEYPCCEKPLFIPMADKTPTWQRHECEHCGTICWTYHSRIESLTYTEKDFLEIYEIDEEKKEIRKKDNG